MTAVLAEVPTIETYKPAPVRPAPTTRAEQIAEGLLIDVTDEARRLGWRHPVHLTANVYERAVRWDDAIEAGKTFPSCEEPQGRLRDLLWQALVAVRTVKRGRRVRFDHVCVPPEGAGVNRRDLPLIAVIGPSDDLKPVVTIRLA